MDGGCALPLVKSLHRHLPRTYIISQPDREAGVEVVRVVALSEQRAEREVQKSLTKNKCSAKRAGGGGGGDGDESETTKGHHYHSSRRYFPCCLDKNPPKNVER